MAKSVSDSFRLIVGEPADKVTSAVLDALSGGWTKAKPKARPTRTKTFEKDDRGRWHRDSDDRLPD